jgi:hypothetical protein
MKGNSIYFYCRCSRVSFGRFRITEEVVLVILSFFRYIFYNRPDKKQPIKLNITRQLFIINDTWFYE